MKEIKNKKVGLNKDKRSTKKKDYFAIIFISISVFMFLLLVFSIYWLKNSLYRAKDQVASEFIDNYNKNLLSESIDPFVSEKGLSNDNKLSLPIDNNQDPSLGKSDAKVKIFYFSDFTCPFCLEQENIIKKIYDKFKQDVRIIWKSYPDISSLDSFSYQASKAARCAYEQEKFWEYNKLLYKQEKNFEKLKNQLFLNLAENLKLNIDKFSTCLSDTKIDNAILNNVSEAEKLEITGIPYIYVNDRDLLGNITEDELEDIVKIELEK